MRLIDADAFLKRNEVYADCEFIHPMYQNTLKEIVDEEPTVPAPRWVRCDERLPEPIEDLLLYDEHSRFHAGYISNYRGYTEFIDYDGNHLNGVTHWMPIEPPQEVQDGTE